jgi:hypothetical protein
MRIILNETSKASSCFSMDLKADWSVADLTLSPGSRGSFTGAYVPLLCQEGQAVEITVTARNRLLDAQNGDSETIFIKKLLQPPEPNILPAYTADTLRVASGIHGGKEYAHIWAAGYTTTNLQKEVMLDKGRDGVLELTIENLGAAIEIGDSHPLTARIVFGDNNYNYTHLQVRIDGSSDLSTRISVYLPKFTEGQFPCEEAACQGKLEIISSDLALLKNSLVISLQYFKYADPVFVTVFPRAGSQSGGLLMKVSRTSKRSFEGGQGKAEVQKASVV